MNAEAKKPRGRIDECIVLSQPVEMTKHRYVGGGSDCAEV